MRRSTCPQQGTLVLVPSLSRAVVTGAPQKVKLSFKLPYRCSFGQELAIVGSGEALGNWDVQHAKRMHWTSGDVWEVDFEVSTG